MSCCASASSSITCERFANTPICSSAEAAMPMTRYANSPSSHSMPAGNCTTEMPVCKISARLSNCPCGMAMPLPRYVDIVCSRASMPSTYEAVTRPFSTSSAPACLMASSLPVACALRRTSSGVMITMGLLGYDVSAGLQGVDDLIEGRNVGEILERKAYCPGCFLARHLVQLLVTDHHLRIFGDTAHRAVSHF